MVRTQSATNEEVKSALRETTIKNGNYSLRQKMVIEAIEIRIWIAFVHEKYARQKLTTNHTIMFGLAKFINRMKRSQHCG